MSTLALRYVYALFDGAQAHQLVLKQMAILRIPLQKPMPSAAVASRPSVFVYTIDLCGFRTAQRSLALEASTVRELITTGMQLSSRSLVLILFTNVVQFCIDIERYRTPYVGIAGYTGAPGCAMSLYRFIERAIVSAVPANVTLHVATPKVNSRFDFSQRTAPLLDRIVSRLATETEHLFYAAGTASASAGALSGALGGGGGGGSSNASTGGGAFVAGTIDGNSDDDVQLVTLPGGRVVVRHVVVQANKATVERLPGMLPTLSLVRRELSVVHLIDL
jgi:hypothetical protein